MLVSIYSVSLFNHGGTVLTLTKLYEVIKVIGVSKKGNCIKLWASADSARSWDDGQLIQGVVWAWITLNDQSPNRIPVYA